jgi:hypothetical protein
MINRDRKVGFERLLYRATRGNLFMQTESISELMKDPITVFASSACFEVVFNTG